MLRKNRRRLLRSIQGAVPRGTIQNQSGSVQLALSASVAQYAAMLAICQEKDKYGDLQNYICDLDNNVRLDVAAISNYYDGQDPDG